MKLHPADLIVVLVYVGMVVAMGWWFSRRNQSTERYFLGGRNFPGWAIGFSFIGSTISSVTFIAYPADSFKTAWVRYLPNFAFLFAIAIAAFAFIPFFRNGIVRSAYHYLSLRFGASVSVYAAVVYLLLQMVRTSTITYLLAVLLSSLTGLAIPMCILLAASITAIYTVKGGFEAVVWTDVVQTIVLMLGAVACISVIAYALPGGLGQVISEALAAGKLSFQDLNPKTGMLEPIRLGFSLSEKTAVMLVLVGAAQYISGQLDQDSVQRWCSARSPREARKSMWVLACGALPIWATFMFLGTCLWVYFRHFPSDVAASVLAGTRKAEDILPHFIITVLPPGVAGLVISAALAAAMGAMSSSINAAGMVWVNDIYRLYLVRGREDVHYLRISRGASLAMAAIMCGGALLLYRSSAATLMDIWVTMLALIGGGIAAAFLFGILTRLGDARTVLIGIGATVAFTVYATLAQFGVVPRLFNSYYTSILANLVMFTTCCLAAWLLPVRSRDLTNLYDLDAGSRRTRKRIVFGTADGGQNGGVKRDFMASSTIAVKAAWLVIGWLSVTSIGSTASAAQPAASNLVTSYATETRNRANVLLIGEALNATVAERLQKRWQDEANIYRPTAAATDASAVVKQLGAWLEARPWHVVILGVAPGDATAEAYAKSLREIAVALKARKIAFAWSSLPAADDRANGVRFNDAARRVMRAEGGEVADLYGALLANSAGLRDARGGLTERGADVVAETLSSPLKRALFSRSTPWAELPAGEKRDPAKLLADSTLFTSPMELPEAKGTNAMIFRAEQGAWQFNLHSFIAHHDGKFWAMWSSGRVDEDSSSQFLRYATSADGLTWSESAVLAPDPDGESGLWRWMASGIYVDNGRLYALGSLNQGNNPPGGPWANARLVRFVWTGAAWKEDAVVAENCVVYFPPLRIEGRDFFVWRDSRAHFFTGYAPAGTTNWEVTRVPGPLPDYRMSETAAYVDPDGVVHMVIRDQGYTRRLYHSVSHDAGATWTIPVKTNYPDAASKNMAGRLSNGWYYLINNPKESGANARDPLAITFSRDGWTFSNPMALRKNAPALRFKGGAKGAHSFQYSHAIEHDGKLWVIYATNKEDIEISAFPIEGFGLGR